MPTETDELMELIMKIAKVPSFTTYEFRLHPFIEEFCKSIGAKPVFIDDSNIMVETHGTGELSVALSAHLDKNDYWSARGKMQPKEIRSGIREEERGLRLRGLLDDAVGIGVCLHLLKQSSRRKFPPLKILFSECEESFFRRRLTRDKRHNNGESKNGDEFYNGMGARRLSAHLIEQGKIPAAVVVVDVTPLFDGEPGIALYSRPWEIHGGHVTSELENQTEVLVDEFHKLCPRLEDENNTNDYAVYGYELNKGDSVVPCFALEPSVKCYHSPREKVYVDDITETAEVLGGFLEWFAKNPPTNSISED